MAQSRPSAPEASGRRRWALTKSFRLFLRDAARGRGRGVLSLLSAGAILGAPAVTVKVTPSELASPQRASKSHPITEPEAQRGPGAKQRHRRWRPALGTQRRHWSCLAGGGPRRDTVGRDVGTELPIQVLGRSMAPSHPPLQSCRRSRPFHPRCKPSPRRHLLPGTPGDGLKLWPCKVPRGSKHSCRW